HPREPCSDPAASLPSRHYANRRGAGEGSESPGICGAAGRWTPPPRRATISPGGPTTPQGDPTMKLGLINSAWAQAGRDTAFGIRMTREIGFDTIDVFADPLDMGVRERRLIPRECERAGLPIVSIACVAVGLVDFNPSVQRFLAEVGHPAVKANIDVSHLQLSRAAPEELRRLKGKAIHVHLSDCDGKVHGDLPPGRGVVDFPPYLREIKALGIDGSVSIELEYSPDPEKIVEWVTEAYEKTAALMRQTGLRG